jgi:metacaspase-1
MKTAVQLVGINTYPGAPLNGCVPDIKAWCDLLPSKMLQDLGQGYKYSDLFSSCTDKRATAMGMKERLARLVMAATPGDRLFFGYSGHGAPVVTRGSSGEADGVSEALCPVDFNYDDPDTWIIDTDLIEVFSQLPETVSCTIVLDSCFSGGMTAGVVERSANPGYERKSRAYPLAGTVDYDTRLASAKALGVAKRQLIHETLKNVVVIMGCQENQTCADAWLGNGYQGALTYYLIQAIKDEPGRSVIDTVAAAAGKLKSAGFDQVPYAVGPERGLLAPFGADFAK